MAEILLEPGVRAGRKSRLNKLFAAMTAVITDVEKQFARAEPGPNWCFLPKSQRTPATDCRRISGCIFAVSCQGIRLGVVVADGVVKSGSQGNSVSPRNEEHQRLIIWSRFAPARAPDSHSPSKKSCRVIDRVLLRRSLCWGENRYDIRDLFGVFLLSGLPWHDQCRLRRDDH